MCSAESFVGDADCTGHLDLDRSFNNLEEDCTESIQCLVNRCIVCLDPLVWVVEARIKAGFVGFVWGKYPVSVSGGIMQNG